jgi:hypothetical protein
MDQVSIRYPNIFHCKTLKKFTQIWIFGLKKNHLATLPAMTQQFFFFFVANLFRINCPMLCRPS